VFASPDVLAEHLRGVVCPSRHLCSWCKQDCGSVQERGRHERVPCASKPLSAEAAADAYLAAVGVAGEAKEKGLSEGEGVVRRLGRAELVR